MRFTDPAIGFPAIERAEELARLAYELLDAHLDTEQLMREPVSELRWRAHLAYLRDLQRIGREVLAARLDSSQDRRRA